MAGRTSPPTPARYIARCRPRSTSCCCSAAPITASTCWPTSTAASSARRSSASSSCAPQGESSLSSSAPALVERDGHAGEGASVRPEEEGHRAGDLLGLDQALDRVRLEDHVLEHA